MNVLLDTNAVSEWAKPVPEPRFVHWMAGIDMEATYLSVITLAEIERGILRLPTGQRRENLRRWFAGDLLPAFADRIVDVDPAVAVEWARVTIRCDGAGRPIGAMDAFLAASAIARNLTLVTRNVGDFAASGAALFDPWTESA
jgi:predicted nucleic acid-binding protein